MSHMKKAAINLAIFLCIMFLATLPSCGYSQEDIDAAHTEGYSEGYEKGYTSGYEEGYDDGYDEGYRALKPVSMPASGTILSGTETKYRSEITIKASYGSSHVVSLKTTSGEERVSFFVQSGDTVTIGVPNEKLYVYFASGETWYGYGKGLMFGEDTVYSKDDEILDFSKYTWEYTLHPVTNGNFSETPSSENEFF